MIVHHRCNRYLITLMALTGLLAGAGTACASPISAGTALQEFNAIIYNNGATTSDIEGAAVVGGTFSGGGAFYSNPPASLPAGYGALTVYGNTTGNVININNGGNADVGGTADAHINFNGGGTYIGAPPNIMADFQTSLNDLSQSLANFQATGVLPTSGNNVLINADPNASGMAAIDLTASGLATIPSFQINLADASSLIFRSRT